MKLEQQVCSLELAKKLKELGVQHESYWRWIKDLDYAHEGWHLMALDELSERESYAAFTVAELGEMLPAMCIEGESRIANKWGIDSFRCDTEADVRAVALIYLLKNKLVAAGEQNQSTETEVGT